MLKYVLIDRGYTRIDENIYNKDGHLLTPSVDGKKYVMKQWFEGRECNISNADQIDMAVDNLAVLHKVMENVRFECEWGNHAFSKPGDELMKKRLRELKAIYSYIRGKKMLNDFEILFAKNFDRFYNQGRKALAFLEMIDYRALYNTSQELRTFCHGDYSHHHVLIGKNEIATINFDKTMIGIQMNDLYYFLRKILEKNEWSVELGFNMIHVYHKQKNIEIKELQYLYAVMLFPEKFWKISNHYYNSRKSWTSSVNLQKMKKCIQQEEKRQIFLEQLLNYSTKQKIISDVR